MLTLSASSMVASAVSAPRMRTVSRPRVSASRRMSVVRAEAPQTSGIEKSGPNAKAVKDIADIMAILPHRYPFLLVDRVVEWEHGKHAVGYKCVTINDNFFPGHFPQRAIMPGVLQVEAMAQLGGIVMLDADKDVDDQTNFFFGGVDNVKWRKPVVPGDVLYMRVELVKFNKRFGIAKMEGKAYVGEDLVCQCEMTLAIVEEK